ncbi:MAG: hypothetical protein WC333_00040 [Dehalococcoidia bacterium]|jgi:hypothetical protein
MKEAYLETIRDFEIELENTSLLNFSRRNWLAKKIKYYEELLAAISPLKGTPDPDAILHIKRPETPLS